MVHSDPETLAMMAIGEQATVAETDHVAGCRDCSGDLASLCRVTNLARSGAQESALATPDPVVWSRISRELGFAADVTPAPFPAGGAEHPSSEAVPGSADSAVSGSPLSRLPLPGAVRHDSADGRSASGASAPRRAKRRRWVGPVLIVASAALLVGGISTAVVFQQGAPTVLAEVALDPLPEWVGASGDATVQQDSAGRRDLVVTASVPSGTNGYREVWLISADLSGLVSLGVLDGITGTFAIPAGVNLDEFPIVDVSEELVDGDPGHSGDSIVRGSLG